MSGTRPARRAVIGVATVVACVAAVMFAVSAQYGLPGSTELKLRAAFNDVGSLRVGDDVRVASVRVGYVSGISYEHGQALVDLALQDVDTVYRNASATAAAVGARSALGLKFVDLKPGTPDAGELSDGELIPAAKTQGAQEITDLLEVFDPQTRKALGSTLRETGNGFAGQAENLRDALAALPDGLEDAAAVSRALSAGDGADLTAMLRSLDRVSGRFAGRQQELATLARRLDKTLAAVAVDDGKPLDAALADAPRALDSTRKALRDVRGPVTDLGAAMRNLRPGASSLAAATDDVRGVLTEGVRPLRKLPPVADQALPAVRSLSQVLADARPLAPRLTRAVDRAAEPLTTAASYAPEIADFFRYGERTMADHDDAGHWLRFFVSFSPELVSGFVPGFKDPLVGRHPYPEPGEAGSMRKTTPIGGR